MTVAMETGHLPGHKWRTSSLSSSAQGSRVDTSFMSSPDRTWKQHKVSMAIINGQLMQSTQRAWDPQKSTLTNQAALMKSPDKLWNSYRSVASPIRRSPSFKPKSRTFHSVYSYMSEKKADTAKNYTFWPKHHNSSVNIYSRHYQNIPAPLNTYPSTPNKERPKAKFSEQSSFSGDIPTDEYGLSLRKRKVEFSQDPHGTMLVKQRDPPMKIAQEMLRALASEQYPANFVPKKESHKPKSILKKDVWKDSRCIRKESDWNYRSNNDSIHQLKLPMVSSNTTIKLIKVQKFSCKTSPPQEKKGYKKQKELPLGYNSTELVEVLNNIQRKFNKPYK